MPGQPCQGLFTLATSLIHIGRSSFAHPEATSSSPPSIPLSIPPFLLPFFLLPLSSSCHLPPVSYYSSSPPSVFLTTVQLTPQIPVNCKQLNNDVTVSWVVDHSNSFISIKLCGCVLVSPIIILLSTRVVLYNTVQKQFINFDEELGRKRYGR